MLLQTIAAAPSQPDAAADITEEINQVGGFLNDVWNAFLSFLPTLIYAIVVLIIGMLITKLMLFIMSKGMKRSKIDKTAAGFLSSLVKIGLYLVLLSIVLTILGVPVDSLIAVIASGAVAIGLALQSSLSNFAGGLILLFSKPCGVGDFIEVDGISGNIEKINLLYTEIVTLDNRVVFFPNGQITNKNIINVTRKSLRRVDYVYCISYNEDYSRAEKAIKKVISENSLILNTPEAFVRMSAHSASSIEITVRVWTKTENYWAVYFDMIESVRKEFIENGIEIPYQQLDVHIKEKN